MKKALKLLCIITMIAMIGFTLIVCDAGSGNDGGNNVLLGTWIGIIAGQNYSLLQFTDSDWSINIPAGPGIGLHVPGPYTKTGNTAILYAYNEALPLGTADLTGSNTLRLTLNTSFGNGYVGTFTFTRQQ